jgi:hypothetical protein
MPINLNGNILSNSNLGPEGQPNKQIIKDGLVLHLDAGDLDSYPGSGNTWYDISGNGRNYTFGSGISWNSAGYFTCDGSGVFTGPASNTFGFNTSAENYVESFVQVLSATGNVFFDWRASTVNDSRAIFSHFYYSDGNTYYDVAGCCNADQRISYPNDSDFTAGIRHVAFRTRKNTTPNRQIFKNTVSQVDSGGNTTATVTWDNTTNATIASLWNGRIYSFRAYNRPLTDTERLQNYHAQMLRFGLGMVYYNCGYGCQAYTTNPGCTPC